MASRSACRRRAWPSSGRSSHGVCDYRARQLAPPRPHRALGRDGGRRGTRLAALRQRHFVRPRRAVWRRRRALRHQPGLHRHSAPGRAAVRPRHGDERRSAGQASRRAQQGREDPARLADRPRGQSDRRSTLGRGAAFRRDADLRRAQGLWPCSGLRAPGRRADRRRHLALPGGHQAPRAERHALDRDRSGEARHPGCVRARGARLSRLDPQIAAGAGLRSRAHRRRAGARDARAARARRHSRGRGHLAAKSAPPPPSSSSRPIASTRSRAVSPAASPRARDRRRRGWNRVRSARRAARRGAGRPPWRGARR